MHKMSEAGTRSWTKLDKVHRVIKSNQKVWYGMVWYGMNTELGTKAKNDFQKDFFILMNNSVFRKTMENVRKTLTN